MSSRLLTFVLENPSQYCPPVIMEASFVCHHPFLMQVGLSVLLHLFCLHELMKLENLGLNMRSGHISDLIVGLRLIQICAYRECTSMFQVAPNTDCEVYFFSA